MVIMREVEGVFDEDIEGGVMIYRTLQQWGVRVCVSDRVG